MNTQPVSGQTVTYCLIASPAAQSSSPALHNASFQILGCDARYLAFDVKPEGLPDAVALMKAAKGFCGGNVGVPHKQAMAGLCDDLSEAARLIGSVNTFSCQGGTMMGHNTDAQSFVLTCKDAGAPIKGATICFVDVEAEGPAYIVAAALEGAKRIDVLTEGRLQEELSARYGDLAAQTGCEICVSVLSDTATCTKAVQNAQIVCNASRIGTGDSLGISPIPATALHGEQVVMDAITDPRETQLLSDARAAGCHVEDGLALLLNQAACAERLWLDVEMPVAEIKRRFF